MVKTIEVMEYKPKYKVNEKVFGHYSISKVENLPQEYAFTFFKVLKVKPRKNSFIYLLDPLKIRVFHNRCGLYSGPHIHKEDSLWVASDKEDEKIIKSLEGRINTPVVLSEDQLHSHYN